MTVGQDTYITLAEAEETIAAYLLSDDLQRTAWSALSDADKEIYLKRALQRIDAQVFTGRKANADQPLQFPRYGKTTVPASVKFAQALEACAEIGISREAEKREQMQAMGIQSFSAGNISETYARPVEGMLFSGVARRLLRPYLAGGVPFD